MGVSGRAALTYILPRYRNPSPPGRPRTLSGEVARQLCEPVHPEHRGRNLGALMDRLDQGPSPGSQPPHSTEVSDRPWYGTRSAMFGLGRQPTQREVADSHAYVDDAGLGHHAHHFTGLSGVGPASTQACQQHLEDIHGGQSRVPARDQAGVVVHLTRHLRDADAAVPQPAVPPHLGSRSAQRLVEESRIAELNAARRKRLLDSRARDSRWADLEKRI